MAIEKTYTEINERIRAGRAVVVTAEEAVAMVREKGVAETARAVDVVTTGTFSPMCSSGVYFNFGHARPRIKAQRIWLNGVPCGGGLAAVDGFLGATALPEDDPANANHPGEFRYGGGHVIHDLVSRREIHFRAVGYGTDCYPRREVETWLTIDDMNEVVLFNPRNAYQNYNVAVNLGSRTIYTYMGILKPRLGNAHYATSGLLSPLMKDPYFRTIGIGTRIFLGGGVGHVVWHGTQHFPSVKEGPVPGSIVAAGGTLAVMGDLKQMRPEWLVGASIVGYGASLFVGIGLPIPVLNEEILYYAALGDEQLYAPVVDYSEAYPQRQPDTLGLVSYADLKSGRITVCGKEVPTAPLSSFPRAREIAAILKEWIRAGQFLLAEPTQLLPPPGAGLRANVLDIRPPKGE